MSHINNNHQSSSGLHLEQRFFNVFHEETRKGLATKKLSYLDISEIIEMAESIGWSFVIVNGVITLRRKKRAIFISGKGKEARVILTELSGKNPYSVMNIHLAKLTGAALMEIFARVAVLEQNEAEKE